MELFLLISAIVIIFFIGFLIVKSIQKHRKEKIKKQIAARKDVIVQPQYPFIPFDNVVWKHPLDNHTQQTCPISNPGKNKKPPFPKSTIHRESEMPNERPRKSYSIVSDPDVALVSWDPLEISALNQVMKSMIEEEQDPNKFITKPNPEDHSHHFSGAGSSGGWMTSDDSRNNFSGASSDDDGGSLGGNSYVIDDGSSGSGSSSFDSSSSSSSD